MEVLLFDQDAHALEYVSRRFALQARHRTDVDVRLRHDAIGRLLRDPQIFADYGHVDFVFASGLFDYLEVPVGVGLIRNLHRLLLPGGVLYVGNMVPENPCRWFLEHHLDWLLKYRTREELAAMGEEAVPDAERRLVEDATGINPFLVLGKG